MKRTFWAPFLAIGAAILILVPTTFAVGEPGTTLFAQLGLNRFPNASASVDARLQFQSASSIRLDITIAGVPTRPWGARIYSQGTCNNVLNWVANRDQNGQFISVLSNLGERRIQLFAADVARIRAALAKGQTLSLMVAGTHPVSGLSYRTCTAFRAAPIPPLTTTSASTSATSTVTTATTSASTTTPPVTIPVTTSTPTTTAASTTFSTGTTITQFSTVTTPVTVSTTTGTSVFFTTASESVVVSTSVFTSTTTLYSTYTTGTTITTVTTVTL